MQLTGTKRLKDGRQMLPAGGYSEPTENQGIMDMETGEIIALSKKDQRIADAKKNRKEVMAKLQAKVDKENAEAAKPKELPFVLVDNNGNFVKPVKPEMLPKDSMPGTRDDFFIDNDGSSHVVVHYASGRVVGRGNGRETAINNASRNINKGIEKGMPFSEVVKGKEIDPNKVPDGFALPSQAKPKTTRPFKRRPGAEPARKAKADMKKMINAASISGLPPSAKYERLKAAEDYAKQNNVPFPDDAKKMMSAAARSMLGLK